MSRTENRRPVANTAVSRQGKGKKKKKGGIKSSSVTLFVLLVLLSTALMFQYYRINKVNNQIIALEEKVKTEKMVNDSREGKLMAKRDLNMVEEIATKKYGMVKADQTRFTYVAINKDDSTSVAQKDNANQGGLLDWFANLIQ